MAKLLALITLQAGRQLYPPGSEVETSDDEAQRLVEAGFAEALVAAAESEDVTLFRECNARDAIELIEGTIDGALLTQFAVIEGARKDPRKTVLDALAAQQAALAAPETA
jgi:hypothetical protein